MATFTFVANTDKYNYSVAMGSAEKTSVSPTKIFSKTALGFSNSISTVEVSNTVYKLFRTNKETGRTDKAYIYMVSKIEDGKVFVGGWKPE